MKTEYKVWDELNGEKEARDISHFSSKEAALAYVELDVDGLNDEAYKCGRMIVARGPNGKVRRFEIRVEMEPQFYAKEVRE